MGEGGAYFYSAYISAVNMQWSSCIYGITHKKQISLYCMISYSPFASWFGASSNQWICITVTWHWTVHLHISWICNMLIYTPPTFWFLWSKALSFEWYKISTDDPNESLLVKGSLYKPCRKTASAFQVVLQRNMVAQNATRRHFQFVYRPHFTSGKIPHGPILDWSSFFPGTYHR